MPEKGFASIDIHSNLNKEQIHGMLLQLLPDFQWRQGDSDMSGPYLSGQNVDGVGIKFWLGESPIACTVSFRSAWAVLIDRDQKIQQFMESFNETVLPAIGNIIKTSFHD